VIGQANQLPSSAQFDLARSSFTLGDLQQTAQAFGAPQPEAWGFGDVMNHLTSQMPETFQIGDLSKLQQNLVQMGYVPQDVPISGQWNGQWNAALHQMDSQATQAQIGGHHLLSAPFEAGLRLIGNTLPANVFQGVVGAAKGLVMETPQVFEQSGLLGGAAEGAVVGAVAGSVIPVLGTATGAVIGGLVGAAGGLLSNLLHNDKADQGISGLQRAFEAVIPYREYQGAGGARKFFEDLGWVLTASSMIKGGALGVGLVSDAAGAITGGAAESGSLLSSAMAPQETEPGWFTRITSNLAKPVVGPGNVAKWKDWVTTWGPKALQTRPGFQLVSGAYTGLSTAQIGARYFGGIDQGLHPTVISQQIAKAPLPLGPSLPGPLSVLGPVGDLAAWVIMPTQFFPAKLSELATAARKLEGDVSLKPYIDLAMEMKNPDGSSRFSSMSDARAAVQQYLGSNPAERALNNTHLRVQYGLMRQGGDMVREENTGDWANLLSAQSNAKFQLVRDLRTQAQAGDRTLANKLMQLSFDEPTGFQGYLRDLTGQGSGLDVLKNHMDASKLASQVRDQIESGQLPVKGGKMSITSGLGWQRAQTQGSIMQLQEEVKALKRQIGLSPDPLANVAAQARIEQATSQLTDLQEKLASLPATRKRSADEMFIAPVRAETHLAADLRQDTKTFDVLRKSVIATREAVDQTNHAQSMAQFSDFVDGLVKDGVIPDDMAKRAKTGRPSREIGNALSRQAKVSPHEVDLPDQLKKRFADLGYKPALTGSDILLPHQIDQVAEVHGLGDYTRRAALFDTLGLGLSNEADRSIYRLRESHMSAEIQQVLDQNGIKSNGRAVLKRLYDSLRDQQSDAAVGALGRVKNVLNPKIDVRQLTPLDIHQAFEDIPGVTIDAADQLFKAVKRGSAYGGEVSLMHPLDTARAIGRALRINGLPGFNDTIRNWHIEDPNEYRAQLEGRTPAINYTPRPDFRYSDQRKRFERELVGATIGATKVQAQHRQFLMMMLDAGAKASGQSADEFYRGMTADFAKQYSGEPGLMQQVYTSTTHEQRMALVRKNMDFADWYERSAEKLGKFFPMDATSMIGEGANQRPISDYELFLNVLAVTSWQSTPEKNLLDAIDAFGSFKRGEDVSSSMEPNKQDALREIFAGHTIDRWAGKTEKAPELGKQAVRVTMPDGTVHEFKTATARNAWVRSLPAGPAYEAMDKRLKTVNYFHNMMTEVNRVTVDRRIKVLYGYPANENSPTVIHAIEQDIRQASDHSGLLPMQHQAALWAGFKDWLEERNAAMAGRTDQEARDFRYMLIQAKSNDSYDVFLDRPDIREKMLGLSPGVALAPALAQRIEGDVRGMTQFGPDYGTMMRFFRGADGSTLVHEGLHAMRQLVSPEDMAALEEHYGVTHVAAPVVGEAAASPMKAVSDKSLERLRTTTLENGGATWSPHTGRYAAGKGHAVAINNDTAATFTTEEARANPSAFAAKVRQVVADRGDILKMKRAHVGTWVDGDTIHIDVSEVVPSRTEALKLGAQRNQKAVFDLGSAEDVPVPAMQALKWPDNAEESFAYDLQKAIMRRVFPAPIKGPMGHLRDAIGNVWAHVRGHVADRYAVSPAVQQVLDHQFGDVLSQFPEPHPQITVAPGVRRAVLGAAAGAAVGEVEGGNSDVAKGALLGAGAGVGLNVLARYTHGYLPDALARANSALRFSLSPAFDARRYAKTNLIAMTRYDLPGILRPRSYIQARDDFRSLNDGRILHGEEAWREAVQYWDKLNGTSWFRQIDDVDRNLFAEGLLGYAPKNMEAAYSYLLKQRGWEDSKIIDAVSHISRYGVGRTAAEKTVNYIFFPFSFEKKLISQLSDAVLQAPARNLLIYQGLRNYYSMGLDKRVNDLLQNHAPLLNALGDLNAFRYGLGPGEFMLSGLGDRRSNLGRVSQALATVMGPGAVGGSLSRSAGLVGDMAAQAFVPIVVTGEGINRLRANHNMSFSDVAQQYIPLIHDLSSYASDLGEQTKALTQGETSYAQMQDYYDQLSEFDQQHAPLALAMGYQDVSSFYRSNAGQYVSQQRQQLQNQLATKYPSGFQLVTQSTDGALLNQKAFYDLLRNPHRTVAENQILGLHQQEQEMSMMKSLGLMSSSLEQLALGQSIREEATKHTNDPQFVELYNLLFEPNYGPIQAVA